MDNSIHPSDKQPCGASDTPFDLELAKSVGQMIEQGRKAPPSNQSMRVGVMVFKGKELLKAEIANNGTSQSESADPSPA